MLPCAEGLCEIIHYSVGALFGYVDEYDASAWAQSRVYLLNDALEVGDVAWASVEKNGVVDILWKVEFFRGSFGDFHAATARDVGH